MATSQLTPCKLETVKVASLTDRRGRWKICVKVKRKFEKKISGHNLEYFKVVLMDDSGMIDALAFGSQNVGRFFSKFEKNKVYIISDGKVRKANQTYSNIHDYEILLKPETSVTLCKDMVRQSTAKMQHTHGVSNSVSPRLIVTSQQAAGMSVTSPRAPGTRVTSHQIPGRSVTSHQIPGTSVTSLQTPGTSITSHQAAGMSVTNLQAAGTSVTNPQASRHSVRSCQASRLSVLYTPLYMLNQTKKTTVDVIGKVTGVWKLEIKYRNYFLRKLNISDLDRTDLKVALWNRQAVEFRTSCIDSVIALKKMKLKNINGCTELESTKDTEIEYSPLSPEALGLNEVIDLTDNDEHVSVSVGVGNSKHTQTKHTKTTECNNAIIPRSNDFVKLLKRRYQSFCQVLSKAGQTSKTTACKAADNHDFGEGRKTSATERPKSKSSRNLNLILNGTDVESNKECNKVDMEKEDNDSEMDKEDMTDDRIVRSNRELRDNSEIKVVMEHEAFSLPVTPTQSDSDGENSEQPIKPVSSTKKHQKVASSDSEDSDSTMSYTVSPVKPGSPGSVGKRSHHSGDDSDDDCGGGKELTHSAKKKFKRIKEIKEFSQESNQVDDQEDAESNEDITDNSETSISQSGEDSDADDDDIDDFQWIKTRPEGGREYIQKLRVIREDDDGTRQLFRHYLLWMAMTAGGESCDGDDFEETDKEKCKLEGRLQVAMGVCQSQAWSDSVRKDIKMYPEFVDGMTHDCIEKGDIGMIEKCQVCNREDHPWEYRVTLKGNPYNRETFEEEEADDDEDFLPVEYFMGRFCHPRTKLFHKLYHFGYHLYKRCKSMLEEGKTIDGVATNRSLQDEMCDKLKRWLKEVEDDYTDDGARANKKWKKEFEDGCFL